VSRTNRLWVALLAVFVALSAADFTQTYALIHTGDGAVYEANPVAAPWLERYGWHGLALYKVAAVLVVAGVVVVLAGRSRRAAAGVVGLGCAALLAVTLYSRDLIANGPRPVEEDVAELDADWYRPAPSGANRLLAARPPLPDRRVDDLGTPGGAVRAE
jgi:hypothetical protein